MSTQRGLFVTVDGPNGVGKTTLTSLVAKGLVAEGKEVLLTKEPSDSNLGNFIRNSEESFIGQPLACLIAADRHYHIDRDVKPALFEGKIVVCDRYIASSIVLQQVDGVALEYIWAINQLIFVPDLSIFLSARPEILTRRLSARQRLTRLEILATRDEEIKLYREAESLLAAHNFKTVTVNNDINYLEETVSSIVSQIVNL